MKLPKGLGNMGNIGALMKQAQDAMQRMQQLEEELKTIEVETDRLGVKVKFSAAGELLSISINPDLVDPADIESLEDGILLAIREGQNKASEIKQTKTQEITGSLNLPGGMPGF